MFVTYTNGAQITISSINPCFPVKSPGKLGNKAKMRCNM